MRTELWDLDGDEHALYILGLGRIILHRLTREAAAVPKARAPMWQPPGPE